MDIITDSREQIRLWDEPIARICKLEVGDYSTGLLVGKFHVERKSPQDLYSTILSGHARFKREILRAEESNTKLVVFVECPKKNFISKTWPGGFMLKCKSAVLAKIISTMSLKYDQEFVWCDDRDDMRRRILARFELEEQKVRINLLNEKFI